MQAWRMHIVDYVDSRLKTATRATRVLGSAMTNCSSAYRASPRFGPMKRSCMQAAAYHEEVMHEGESRHMLLVTC